MYDVRTHVDRPNKLARLHAKRELSNFDNRIEFTIIQFHIKSHHKYGLNDTRNRDRTNYSRITYGTISRCCNVSFQQASRSAKNMCRKINFSLFANFVGTISE